MCQHFVKENLKAPSTADFGGLFEDWEEATFLNLELTSSLGVDVSQLRGPGVWVVTGKVDAQNEFGAMLRSDYVCVMDYESATDMWYLLDISIE